MFILLSLVACEPSPTDVEAQALQLESASVSTDACADWGTCSGDEVASGALATSAGAAAGDLSLTVGETVFAVHSPTGVDLAPFDGDVVSAAVVYDWGVPASLALSDDTGLVYIVESGSGDAFAAIDVQYGEELGSIVDDADYKLTFRTLEVATDEGAVVVKPGEVRAVRIDGLLFRFGAIAAYETSTIPGGEYTGCGGERSMMSYELLRIDEEATFPSVTRPADLPMALSDSCAG